VRLAWKIFLTTSLVILVQVAVATVSLVAVNRLVEVNRAVASHAVPAMRLESSLRESARALFQLEGRYAVLGDKTYRNLWSARAARLAENLERLNFFITTDDELRLQRKSVAAFAAYRRLVAEQGAPRGARARAAALPRRQTSTAAARTARSLARLSEATYAGVRLTGERARALEQRTWTLISIALPASLLLALLGAALLAFRMARSLRRLSAATAEVVQGSFTGALEVQRRDEIGELARAFNRMAERLGEADRAKEEFFSNITHEFRTPISAVLEATELLRHEALGTLGAQQQRLVEMCSISAERALGLVNEILDLSRMRAGLVELRREPVDLTAVVARSMAELRSQAEARGLTVESNGSAGEVPVLGDEQRLLEVLVNLLGNAIKFTPAGGRVGVRLAERQDEVEIVVEDTGAGIPAEALARVFDRYWQVPGTQGGTGLGLAIVKGIVEAHGGGVTVESEVGKGSRFTIRLPKDGAP